MGLATAALKLSDQSRADARFSSKLLRGIGFSAAVKGCRAPPQPISPDAQFKGAIKMTAHDQLLLHHALFELEARYWHEVDCNAGRRAHEFYVADGLMVVGHNQFRGREKIKEFYQWREGQARNAVSSVKTIRHLINNLYVKSSTPDCAKVLGIVSFYGSVQPAPARQAKPPVLIADLINECVLDADNCWRFRSHTLRPVFLSYEAALSIAVDTGR